MFNHQKLHCYGYALELAKMVPSLIQELPKGYSDIADQLKRAMISVPLNIAEGNYRGSVQQKRYFFSIARGSAGEVASILEIMNALQLIKPDTFEYMHDKLLQIVKMLYKLA